MIQFPANFLWGAATSSYQVEGFNAYNDWWAWEQSLGKGLASGAACRHYELFNEDFDLARSLHHNAHRFSIEWSRIEPREGEILAHEVEHYRQVVLALKARGISPIVTLHHFTNPQWFMKLGGWGKKENLRYFLRFVERIVSALAPDVHTWLTVNEPLVYVYYSYLRGEWPPQIKSVRSAKLVRDNFIRGHICAYQIIQALYRKKNLPAPSISIAHHMRYFSPCAPTLKNTLGVWLRDREVNFTFIEHLLRAHTLDFIGVNYYTRELVDVSGWGIRQLYSESCSKNHHPVKKNDLGWDIYPEGLYELLRRLKRYNLPILITENGICTHDDNLRWEYIREHIKAVHRALQEAVQVKGYLYWSLLDNFEWDKGFGPRFGLVEMDYATCARKVRQSAKRFAEVCQRGALEDGTN